MNYKAITENTENIGFLVPKPTFNMPKGLRYRPFHLSLQQSKTLNFSCIVQITGACSRF